MTDSSSRPRWISEYDYPNRRVSLTLADPVRLAGDWTGIRLDNSVSDPAGRFDVFVTYDHRSDDLIPAAGPIVKVVATLDEQGDLTNAHPDFNIAAIGSLTIWPYRIAGERFGLEIWVRWTTEELFRGSPRSWADATSDQL